MQKIISFARKCLINESSLVRYVANSAIFHGRMFSTLGQNVQHCCVRYSVSPSENNSSVIEHVCKSRYSQEDNAHVMYILELIMLKRDLLYTCDKLISVSDICAVIRHVCRF